MYRRIDYNNDTDSDLTMNQTNLKNSLKKMWSRINSNKEDGMLRGRPHPIFVSCVTMNELKVMITECLNANVSECLIVI
jgi:hypothetical protein